MTGLSKRKILSGLTAGLAVVGMVLTGCNSNSQEYEDLEMYNSSTAVNGFSLKPNAKVMANLDSVHFAIDLRNAVVYNADSLPVGTDVSKLVPVISLPKQLSAAVIDMRGGKVRVGEVDYLKNPSDSIDFTGTVTLRLTAYDGTMRNYDLKVNVHRTEPDSIVWTNMARTKLPSRFDRPRMQKTVSREGTAWCLIEEADGTHTLSKSLSNEMDIWDKSETTLPQGSDVRSFAAATDKFYILAESDLYSSADGEAWEKVERGWISLLGAFGDGVVGVREEGAALFYAKYPQGSFVPYAIDDRFPLYGGSNLCTFSNKWSTEPIVFFVGGRDRSGNPQSAVWGFDGTTWTQMSETPPPALQGATIVPYAVYLKTSSQWVQNEISAWLAIGGTLADGTLNRTVYVSYDTGVNWHKANKLLQLPPEVPSLTAIDNVVSFTRFEGSLNSAWEALAAPDRNVPKGFRVKYEIDGYEVGWECPYIYLFGGYDAASRLNTDIWRGVLSRMTFIPVI